MNKTKMHYSGIGFRVLHEKAEDELFGYLLEKKNSFVIMCLWALVALNGKEVSPDEYLRFDFHFSGIDIMGDLLILHSFAARPICLETVLSVKILSCR